MKLQYLNLGSIAFVVKTMVPHTEKYHPFKPFQSKQEFINSWRKNKVFGGKECSLKQYQVLATVCLFPFKRSPLFKVGIKIDILETHLIRHNEAEPHFNFRDSGRYVKNTPKRIISYLYDRWQLLQPHKHCLYSHSHPDFYRGETITSHSNLMGFEYGKSSDRLGNYHITFQRTLS